MSLFNTSDVFPTEYALIEENGVPGASNTTNGLLLPDCTNQNNATIWVDCHRQLIGILLAVFGNTFISISLSVQKLSHNR